MDYDINDATNPMGMDGCIDFDHSANAGLSDIWCDDCDLTAIYNAGYASSMSRADFWVASANAVIFITSGGELELKDTFAFGRATAETCDDSATRLPEDSSCNFVEDVFLNRLNMTWTNAVALLGAHTLGRGSINFSGHDGIWVDTIEESLVFDKRYYEEIFRRAWVPRNLDDNGVPQDFTWGNRNGPGGNGSPRFMLNTDLCLAFDIDVTRSDNAVFPCCTRNDLIGNNGNQCENRVDGFDTTGLTNHACNPYLPDDPRIEAANAVNLFSDPRTRRDGSQGFSNDNTAFFEAFREAWGIATTNGLSGLQPLTQTCDTSPPTDTPTAAPQLPTSSPSSSDPTLAPTDDPTLHVSLLYEFCPDTFFFLLNLYCFLLSQPTTDEPSRSPSKSPIITPSHEPSKSPSAQPITAEPTTDSPSVSPSHGPSKSPSTQPVTAHPTSASPTSSPSFVTSSPTASCIDAVPLFTDSRGRNRDCAWAVDNNRCNRFAHHCRLSCGECDCLLDNRVCEADGDCCSNVCLLGQCSCLRGRESCTSNEQCCSGNCSNGECRRA